MIIDIVSDPVCPWCYIGKRRLERALVQAPQPDLKIGWRPFQLNPDIPPEGMDRRDYLRVKFGDQAGGKAYERIVQIGRDEGIPFDFKRIRRQPNTILAHRFIRWAARKERQDEIVEAVFRAYFTEGADIGRPETLVPLAEAVGLDGGEARSFLEGDEDRATIVAEDEFARQIGIQGVPCFIIDRKFALSGAQEPEAFIEVFGLARGEPAGDVETSLI